MKQTPTNYDKTLTITPDKNLVIEQNQVTSKTIQKPASKPAPETDVQPKWPEVTQETEI